ncbi:MAG: type II secretion system GspH family protein [Candidatus Gastranaerophilales bacterium]|nr:type II secretion system GspH family protein [Candidatus Gastranaerophilales bacterium]
MNKAFTLAEGTTYVAMPPVFSKTGFTLAEVLITLGIIGVVAAITIPGLITTYKAHQLRAQFLKSYSVIQQVFKQMEADDIAIDPSDYYDNTNGRFYKTFIKYLTNATNCGDLTNKTNNPVCYDYSQNSKDNPYKTLDGKTDIAPSFFDDGQILLSDGTLLLFENPSNAIGSPIFISVDLNGYKKLPNRWGYDLFTFRFMDGELKTVGDKNTSYTVNTYCNINTTNSRNGIACAHRAKTESDYFIWAIKNIK